MSKPISLCTVMFFIALLFLNSSCKEDETCENLLLAKVYPSTTKLTDSSPCDFTLYIDTTYYYAVNLPDSLKRWDGTVNLLQILVKYHKLNGLYNCNSGKASLQFEKIELDCIETF